MGGSGIGSNLGTIQNDQSSKNVGMGSMGMSGGQGSAQNKQFSATDRVGAKAY